MKWEEGGRGEWNQVPLKLSSPSEFMMNLFFCFWSHHVARRILVPRPGIQPVPPAVEAGVLTTGPPGRSLWWTSSSKTLFPCLFCPCSPQNWGVSKKRGDWNQAGLYGVLLGTKAPLCTLFPVCRKRVWFPRPFLRSKEQTKAVIN